MVPEDPRWSRQNRPCVERLNRPSGRTLDRSVLPCRLTAMQGRTSLTLSDSHRGRARREDPGPRRRDWLRRIGCSNPLRVSRQLAFCRRVLVFADSLVEFPSGGPGSGNAKPPGRFCPASAFVFGVALIGSFLGIVGLGSPTARATFEYVSVVQETVEHGR